MTNINDQPSMNNKAPHVSPVHYRWITLALLWLLYTVFGMVNRSIFPLVTPILDDLHLSFSQMGIILGSWQLTYILVALVAGTILDRWGVHKSVLAGAIIIGLSAALRYLADGFATMLFAVALFGLGGPMISIGGPKTISELFQKRSRGTAIGIYTTGPWIGGLLALALTNSLVMPLVGNSWRLAFVCYGLLAFFASTLWGIIGQNGGAATSSKIAGMFTIFHNLFGIRNVRILLMMALFSFAISHGFSSWLPKILEVKGMSASQAGIVASIPLATGIPAILLIPRLVPPRLRGHVIAIFAVLAALNLAIVMPLSSAGLHIVLAVFGFISSPFLSLMLLILMDTREVDSKYMGAAGGMFFCVAEIGGFTGPLLMGVLVDATGSFWTGVLFLAGLCMLIAGLTRLLTTRNLTEKGE